MSIEGIKVYGKSRFMTPSIFFELMIGLWLLIKGVNARQGGKE